MSMRRKGSLACDESGNFRSELDRKRFFWSLTDQEKREYVVLIADRFLRRQATIGQLRAAVKAAKGE